MTSAMQFLLQTEDKVFRKGKTIAVGLLFMLVRLMLLRSMLLRSMLLRSMLLRSMLLHSMGYEITRGIA
jgi:hypothetical protein